MHLMIDIRLNGWKLTFLSLLAGTFLSLNPALAQIGPCAIPTGPHRPDLIVDQEAMRSQIFLDEQTFGKNSCTIIEGCLASTGKHLLLRFTSSTPNIGKADMVIGDPTKCPNLFDLLHFSECHQHYHFQQYADYRLWTVDGYQNWVAQRNLTIPTNTGINARVLDQAQTSGQLIKGRKQGFCLVDDVPYPFDNVDPGPPVYQSCTNNQGLKVGWADTYGYQLPCQFIDLNDVPEGTYILEDHVNPEQFFPESDYTNNSSAVQFYFTPKHGNTPAAISNVIAFP